MSLSSEDSILLKKIRTEIVPASEILEQRITEFSSAISGQQSSDQTQADVGKMVAGIAEFREMIDTWFPEKPDDSVQLRSSRHDSRNKLNHLFGAIQLLQIAPEVADHVELVTSLCEALEDNLKIISQQPTEPSSSRPLFSAESAKEETAGSQSGEDAIILVADDDPENREIYARLLEPNGFECHFAENGRIAVEKIENGDFDAVLLDIQMPEMDGFEVLSRLRETGQLRQTPVIVVTGLQEEQDAVRCIEIGAEDFLSRPIRPALLMARLNASLEKKRLREQVFEQHFTRELARELARNPDPMKMQARKAQVSVLFCDIRRFSTISERLGPTQTIDWLSGVMGEFSTSVIDHGGVLVDYTGDELMAMWGAPNEQPNHAELACKAAIEILDKLPAINEKWGPIVDAETLVGVGINSGEALVGNIGTHKKFKYGPLGTVVNLASRVQGATKYLKTPLLITGNTREQLPDDLMSRRLCQVRVQNIRCPVDLYQVASGSSNSQSHFFSLSRSYEKALTHFEKGEYQHASAILGDVLVVTPNDGPSLQLMSRVVEAMLGQDEDFSTIWELPGK